MDCAPPSHAQAVFAFSVIYLKSITETDRKSQPPIFIFYLHIVLSKKSFTVCNGFFWKNLTSFRLSGKKSREKRCGKAEVVVQFMLRNHRIF